MTITKKENKYTVKESATAWTLSTASGGVSVEFKVNKADCPTLEELKAFIAENTAL